MSNLRFVLPSLLVLCLCVSVQADETPVEPVEPAAPVAPVAPEAQRHVLADVLVDGALVMQVRGTASFPAARRAKEIADNIIAAARDPNITVDAVTIRVEDDRTVLLAGDLFLVDVFETDAEIEDLSRELLAQSHQDRIREVIADYRSQRTPEVLLTKGGYALATLLGAALLIFGFWRAYRGITDLLDRRLRAQLKQIEAKSARLIRSRSLLNLLRGLTKLVFVALVLVTAYAATHYALGLFPYTRGFAVWLFGLILNPLREIGLGVLATLPSLGWLVVLFLIAKYLLGMIHAFFRGVDSGDIKLASLDRDLAWPTYRIIRLVVIIFTVVMAYPHIPGSDSTAFKGLSVLLGLVVSLGSQAIIGNIIAGYSLIYRRPFRIGDRIKIDDVVGDVTDLRVLSTRLRTLKNEEVVIPNTSIINNGITNYSTMAREQGLILHTTVGIGYETPWRQVEAMLKEAVARTGGLLDKPKPFVLQQALGDFAVTYEINAYCKNANTMPQIRSALHRNILDVFNEYGVAIMTPSYVADPEEPKLVPKAQWYAPPAAASPSQTEPK